MVVQSAHLVTTVHLELNISCFHLALLARIVLKAPIKLLVLQVLQDLNFLVRLLETAHHVLQVLLVVLEIHLVAPHVRLVTIVQVVFRLQVCHVQLELTVVERQEKLILTNV